MTATIAAVHHARRVAAPLLDLRALAVPTYALATATAGFVSRVAINASPFSALYLHRHKHAGLRRRARRTRLGASTLGTMLQRVSLALGVALGAMVLGASQAPRGAPAVDLAGLRHAWYVVGRLMAIATLMALRLDRHAGVAGSRRA